MKKIIIPAIIIIALAIAYYFVSFLPSQKLAQTEQDRQAFLFNKQTECKNICESLYQDEKKTLADRTVFNPQYSYNENKNACFYSGGWFDAASKYLSKHIINCQSNEEILNFTTINDEVYTNFCDTCVSSADEYGTREKEYMGN